MVKKQGQNFLLEKKEKRNKDVFEADTKKKSGRKMLSTMLTTLSIQIIQADELT